MGRFYEVTTIAGPLQRYEVIEVSPVMLANKFVGANIRTVEGDPSGQEDFAGRAQHLLSQTGLEEAIKEFPERTIINEIKQVVIAPPDRLRLIYDVFPGGRGCAYPLLRVCPIEGRQIYLAEYDFSKAELPLKNVTFSSEFEGSLEMRFTGLDVSVHLRNFEKENEAYYSRKLKANRNGKAEFRFT
jgi:hypothetical protein